MTLRLQGNTQAGDRCTQLGDAQEAREVRSLAAEFEVGWVSITGAGAYTGLAPDVIRRAIMAGDLEAYVKPATRREHGRPQYRVSKRDLDKWMRSQRPAREVMGK